MHDGTGGAATDRVGPVAIEAVLADVEIQGGQVVGAELQHRADHILEPVVGIGVAHLAIQFPQAVQDEFLQRRHLVQRQVFGLVEIGHGPQQVAHGVAQLAIGIDRGLQDLFPDPLVLGVVHECDPETQDVGPRLLDDDGRVGGVALGLGHLLPVLVLGEAVGQHGLIGRAATGAAAFEQVGLEPAAMLVRALEIEVGRPV